LAFFQEFRQSVKPAVLSRNSVRNRDKFPVPYAGSHRIEILIGAIPLCCNNVAIFITVNDTAFIKTSKLKYFKILATCFRYSEPSSDQQQNEVRSFCCWSDDGSL
jgi:hypothetical protein